MLPLESQGRPTDLEEERRLFYVGLTRAREELILTTAQAPSLFLSELPDTVVKTSTAPLRERPPPAAATGDRRFIFQFFDKP